MRDQEKMHGSIRYTLLGFAAILIWGTSAAFTKNLSSSLGAFTAASLVNIIGGILIFGKQLIFDGGMKSFKGAPRNYWIICGTLFVIYTATSYVSMTMVDLQEEIMTLVLIRFLWPLFTLVLAIPILKAKASPWLIASVTVSFLGILVAKVGSDWGNLSQVFRVILNSREGWAYGMGLVVSLSWALYTNLTKKYLHNRQISGVGIYMLLSGIILGMVALNLNEPRVFSMKVAGELMYQALFAASIANVFWDVAIKKGNMLVVVLASNFLPIISTVMTAIMLGLEITRSVFLGAVLVVFGTIWSKKCFDEESMKVNKNVRREQLNEV